MATITSSAASGVGVSAVPRPPEQAVKFSAYAAALREAGVGEDDLRLLRELAEMNASDLSHPEDFVQSSRVLL